MPVYPQLVLVPGYPVYYDSRANSNYFFYDGLYWVFMSDNWYVSSWYNGPWGFVDRYYVPVYILRVPVRYYRQPPAYFRGWQADAPPRWDEHWGRGWGERRSGWKQWDQRSVPPPAPLPIYQRQYSGDRYPREVEQQHSIRSENYRYEPREEVTQQHFKRPVRQQQDRQQDQQRQQGQDQQRQQGQQGQQQDQQGQDQQDLKKKQDLKEQQDRKLQKNEPQGDDRENKGEDQGQGRR